jgi:hypothetical protein
MTISFDGVLAPAQPFTIVSGNRQEVSLDIHDGPLMFRTEVDGTQIEFMFRASLSDSDSASKNDQ